MFWKRFFKGLHDLSAAGVIGGFAAILVMVAYAPDPTASLEAYAAVRLNIAMVSKWLLVPSLLVALCSGLLAMAVNPVYQNAGWAWLKALLGLGMFEGTLLTVDSSARRAAEIARLAAERGSADLEALATVLRSEWGGTWGLLAIALANIVIAVWRPRFTRLPD